MPTEFRAGTSGYSYKEWRGHFYPEDMPQDGWLTYYASQLPTVEINNTFYRMPRQHVVEGWRDSVGDDFQFVLKASRRITHQKRLRDTDEPMSYLLHRAELLGPKLGALLFQLPPNMRVDLDRLQTFQALLPTGLPVAFEFRHESWLDPEVDAALQARDHARVVSHDTDSPATELMTSTLCYLRLRASNYTAGALRKWRSKIEASGAESAYVFFKHEDAGGGPKMAAKFLGLDDSVRAAPKRASRKANEQVASKSAVTAVRKVAPKRAARKKSPARKKAAPRHSR